ncbi:hypothetical protein C8J57DRAFT_1246294 [Mycena rebaudengoi]|nr:hypothetical protein C8J57DRAFT_1246294 [Mycena rebaudengoi]
MAGLVFNIVYGFQFPAGIDCTSNVIAHLHGASVNKTVITSRSKLILYSHSCWLYGSIAPSFGRVMVWHGEAPSIQVTPLWSKLSNIIVLSHIYRGKATRRQPSSLLAHRYRAVNLATASVSLLHLWYKIVSNSHILSYNIPGAPSIAQGGCGFDLCAFSSGSETSGATSNQTLCTFPARFLCFAYNQMDVEGKNLIRWTPSA